MQRKKQQGEQYTRACEMRKNFIWFITKKKLLQASNSLAMAGVQDISPLSRIP